MKPIREILFLFTFFLSTIIAVGQEPVPRIEFVTVLEANESQDSLSRTNVPVMLRLSPIYFTQAADSVRLFKYIDGESNELINTWAYDDFPNTILVWHDEASPNAGQSMYFVDYIAPGGGSWDRSSDVHGTIFLEELPAINLCEASVQLSWEPYANIPPPGADLADPVEITGYDILYAGPGNSTGGNYVQTGSVLPDINTFAFSFSGGPGLYRFRIRVNFQFQDGTIRQSYSNSRSIQYVAPPSIDRMEIEKVDVLPGGGIEISWDFQTIDASAFDLILQRADYFSGDYSDISGPLSGVSLFEDTDADPNDGPWYYRLRATFSGQTQCPDTLSSPLSSIFLSHQSGAGGTEVLSWEHFVPGNSPVSYMVLISADNGNNYDDWSGPTSTNEVVIYPGDLNPGQWFFKIRANLNNQVMHSNVVVLMVAPDIRIPNAFRPDSDNPLNRVFKPDFYGFNPLAYSMRIINRWGQLVFETNDHQEAWDGTLGGIALPDGGYRYLIRYSLPDGSSQEHAGIVILVR